MVGTGREDQFAGLGGVPIAEPQPPQAIDHDRPPVRLPKGADAGAVVRVVDVDLAVAEVADNQVSTEIAETARCEREPPRRVELATGDKTLDERAVVGEDVHEAVALPGNV